jgi:hypothetical protein
MTISDARAGGAKCVPEWRRAVTRLSGLALLAGLAACGAASEIPPPRPIVIHSGVRIRADHERMKEINAWVVREQQNIVEDPSFWIIADPRTEDTYVWEGLRISNDSAWVGIDVRAPDTRLVHEIYAHLHLMVALGRQDEWLPEAPAAVGYDLERAILARVADAWMLGRTVFETAPYQPLEELIYAKDAGFLDAFIFTARPDEFASARADWARANPEASERYRDWFLDTFSREPPGLRTG